MVAPGREWPPASGTVSKADNLGVNPEGHYDAGGNAWLYVDEIMIDQVEVPPKEEEYSHAKPQSRQGKTFSGNLKGLPSR